MTTNETIIIADEDLITNKLVQSIFAVIYLLIFLVGLVGNGLVWHAVLRNKAMQTVTNFFITNLALADILLCLLSVPFTPIYTFSKKWVFGETLCHVVPYAQAVSVCVSTLTLASIAFDRYRLIVHPHKGKLSILDCLKFIVAIWIISLIAMLPFLICMRYDANKCHCHENWPSNNFRVCYSCFITVSQFIIPFSVVSYCYTRIAKKLSKQSELMTQQHSQTKCPSKSINRMLIVMVAMFLLGWLPLNIFNMMSDFSVSIIDDFRHNMFVFFIIHAVAMSSTCHNPFIYGWLNDNFRKEFHEILHTCCK